MRKLPWMKVFGLLLITNLILLSACGGGETEQITRSEILPPILEVGILSVFDVEVMQADTYSLSVTGRKDMVDQVTWWIDGNALFVEFDGGGRWLSPGDNRLKLTLSGKNFRRIHADETCHIETINTITSDTFGITFSGKLNTARCDVDNEMFFYENLATVGGIIELTGQTHMLVINNGTLMQPDARGLTTTHARISNHARTDVHVFVLDTLWYEIHGIGNIYLYNDPVEVVNLGTTSAGRLIRR